MTEPELTWGVASLIALMRSWPLLTIFLIDVTLETCVNGRTVVPTWRSIGDAKTAGATTARRAMKNMVWEGTELATSESLRVMILAEERESLTEGRSDLLVRGPYLKNSPVTCDAVVDRFSRKGR